MSKSKTFKNLKLIFIESHRWRNSDLSSDGSGIRFSFFNVQNLVFLIIALSCSLVNTSINDTVLNGILTFASIYSSLIIPVIIMVYDKYIQNPVGNLDEVQRKSQGAKDRMKIFKNFTSRFVFTALETVVIAIFIIIIVLLYKSMPTLNLSSLVTNYQIDTGLSRTSVQIFFEIVLSHISKTIFIFLIIKFLWFIFYSIGALGDFFNDGLKEDNLD